MIATTTELDRMQECIDLTKQLTRVYVLIGEIYSAKTLESMQAMVEQHMKNIKDIK